MASVSVSHLVIFIASLMIAASVAGTLVAGVDRVSSSMSQQSMDVSERIDADMEIISDSGSDSIYADGTIRLLVKNTGRITLSTESTQVDVLVNGQYMADISVDPLGNDLWKPGSVVEIEIQHTLETGDHRAIVRVLGNESVIVFRVS